jgi:NAD(P)H-hydrate epimerase
VRVILARPVNRLSDASRHQLATLLEMSVECCVAIYDVPDEELDRELALADAVIDAVLGYRGTGAPHDGELWLIDRVARTSVPIISLDLPSGIDADSGDAPGVVVTAAATLTLALPKLGLFRGAGRGHAGRIFVGDVGIPTALYRRLGLDPGVPFAEGPIVRLEADA